jgi:hypothetical protein
LRSTSGARTNQLWSETDSERQGTNNVCVAARTADFRSCCSSDSVEYRKYIQGYDSASSLSTWSLL